MIQKKRRISNHTFVLKGMKTIKCTSCGDSKPESEYNFRNKETGLKQTRCKTCTRASSYAHYKKNSKEYINRSKKRSKQQGVDNRRKMQEYLLNKKCCDCPEKDPVVLQFDHVRGEKIGNVSWMVGKCSWEKVLKEIEKCDIRCANCHLRKTAKDFGWYRSNEL